ncbi:hypothetical protein WMY93_015190 [Mugilogobius chulae]|uniref:Uncharacterized protein n=1 Tax=Mugilogobius chulae TaxID=88201 RepID=A0AAW0P129_9GOBI
MFTSEPTAAHEHHPNYTAHRNCSRYFQEWGRSLDAFSDQSVRWMSGQNLTACAEKSLSGPLHGARVGFVTLSPCPCTGNRVEEPGQNPGETRCGETDLKRRTGPRAQTGEARWVEASDRTWIWSVRLDSVLRLERRAGLRLRTGPGFGASDQQEESICFGCPLGHGTEEEEKKSVLGPSHKPTEEGTRRLLPSGTRAEAGQ